MKSRRIVTEELEKEAKGLFEEWLSMQGETIPDDADPFSYMYEHASDDLKEYFDEQNE